MRHHINARFAGCLLAVGLTGLAPLAANAQAPSDKWQWEIGIYGWFPSIGGTTSFPSNGSSGPSIDVSAEDVLNSLKMVFMGDVVARKGEWGFLGDIVYADLGSSKNGSQTLTVNGQPIPVNGNIGLDMKSTAWTMAGLYKLASTPENMTDFVFGARLLDINQTLNWSLTANVPGHPTIGRTGVSSVRGSNWDVLIGLKGRYYLGAERKWFLPYYADVGSGESQLTWQVNGGVGYQFSWGSAYLTYRYLDYQFDSGKPLQSMTMSGALVGVAFQF